jgi:co-chaperonin GroES (HSP10)
MQITPIYDNVIFKFVEEVTSTRFINSASSGLIMTSDDKNQTSFPRWGHVLAIGPDCLDTKPNDYILIEGGKWTPSFYLGDNCCWKTDESMIIAISDEPGQTY